MINEKELVKACLNNDSAAQKALYKLFASKMLGVCLRYTTNKMEAEDVLQDGFIKVFKYLSEYKFNGSLEGWVRKIMVNTALNNYKSNLKRSFHVDINEIHESMITTDIRSENLSEKDLLKLIQELPDGYRMVFNLYAIEGYSHKEIGDKLGISENTSKSQLSRARVALQNKLGEYKNDSVLQKTQ